MVPFKKLFYVFVAFFVVLHPAQAQTPPKFGLPVACTPGMDCWVLNYTDTGPASDGVATDPACGARTYEAHKGTDFAIPDEAAMKKGVDVVAAMDGTVARVRDGEPDRWPDKKELEATKAAKKECGNAVLIDHGDGWQTMNCHMKKDSIAVKAGQKIKRGDKIGEVGLSGFTEFPHLHFGLIHKDKVIDPFSGQNIEAPCDRKNMKPLWDPALKLSYQDLVFVDEGFGDAPPKLKTLERKKSSEVELSSDAENLIAHVVILGAREGDAVEFTIRAPDDTIFAQTKAKQNKSRARQLYYAGRKNNGDGFVPGSYSADVTITRAGKDGKEEKFTRNFKGYVR